jgi:hypothetical protein
MNTYKHNADGSITVHKTSAQGQSFAQGGFLEHSRTYLFGRDPIEQFTPLPVGRVIPLSDPSNPSICPVETLRAVNPRVSTRLSKELDRAVRETIEREKRPGGLLYGN